MENMGKDGNLEFVEYQIEEIVNLGENMCLPRYVLLLAIQLSSIFKIYKRKMG